MTLHLFFFKLKVELKNKQGFVFLRDVAFIAKKWTLLKISYNNLSYIRYPCIDCPDWTNDYSWLHNWINRIPVPNLRNVMVKLRLKRCGRKQRATWRTWSVVDFYIHHSLIKDALDSTSFVLFHSNPHCIFCWGVMEIVHDGARGIKVLSYFSREKRRV